MQVNLSAYDIHKGPLILVNGAHPFIDDHSQSLDHITQHYPDVLMERQAASLLQLILIRLNAINSIVPVSGYRSFYEQSVIYSDSLKENGLDFTLKFVALPGCSEHQTGLAIDLALNSDHIDFICPDFPYNGICQAFRKIAPDYGFIQRYLTSKQSITKIAHEPWHFRYVGYPHSVIINKNDFSLEEYIDYLKQYSIDHPLTFTDSHNKIEIFYVAQSEQVIEMMDDALYQVSGNNVDGYIITQWNDDYA